MVVAAAFLGVLLAPLASALPASANGGVLGSGQQVASGSTFAAPGGGFTLAMQSDGNAVVYAADGRVMWNSGTAGQGGTRLIMQTDGNLVAYNSNGTAVWHTGTHGQPGVRMVMQSDGNLVLYRADNRPVWNSFAAGAGSTADAYGRRVLELVNQERARAGLRPVRQSSCGDRVASAWSAQMARTGSFAHQNLGPVLDTCNANRVGENIGAGSVSAEEMSTLWMNSPGHRANILNPAYTHLGVGAVQNSSGRWYATQTFLTL